MIDATYILRRQEQRGTRLAQCAIEAATQHLISLTWFLEPLLHVVPDFLSKVDSMGVVLQRVGAEIETVNHRIHIEARTEAGVFVSVISKLGFSRSRSNLSQLGLLGFDCGSTYGLVSILDGPVVIWP